MAKIAIQFGYTNYVFDDADAVTFMNLLAKAELYKEVWQSKEQGGPLHYIYQQGEAGVGTDTTPGKFTVTLLSDNLYRLAKLAGPPPND